MNKKELVLLAVAAGGRAIHTPVQMQKLLFLLDKKVPKPLYGPHFSFKPYHYGPFDRTVFEILESLEKSELVEIQRDPARRWKTYHLSEAGLEKGEALLRKIDVATQGYIRQLSEFVRKSSFAELVSAIYAEYPDMKARSAFVH